MVFRDEQRVASGKNTGSEDDGKEVSYPGAQTLMHGLRALRAVADGAKSVADIQESLGVSRSTAHRLVKALRAVDYLEESNTGLMLGSELIDLGYSALHRHPLIEVAHPTLSALSLSVGDTVHLAVNEKDTVLYLEKFPGKRGVEMRSRVGMRMLLTHTGIGKALLLDDDDTWADQFNKDLETIRQSQPHEVSTIDGNPHTAEEFVDLMRRYQKLGYTFDLEENEPGIRCVAVPLRGAGGSIVGAISVSATSAYMPRERMQQLVPVVKAHARSISMQLGAPRSMLMN